MGQGFRNLRVNYLPSSSKKPRLAFSKQNARLLGVSRYLVAETDRTDNSPPSAEIRFQAIYGQTAEIGVSMRATDDRELRAAVFYDPQNDSVIGGTELKGKSQTIELKLPLNRNTPEGRSLFNMVQNALKAGANPGSGQKDLGIRIITFLADAGGNIEPLNTPVEKP